MQAKAFLMLTGVQIETIDNRARNVMCSIICRNLYYTQHPQTHSIPTPSTTHIFTYTFVTTSKKTPQNKLQKSTLPKSAKTSHVEMHFHQKLFPKNQWNKQQCTLQCMCRLPTHHIAMHLPCSYHPYIFPTTPTTIHTTPPYSTAHPIQHTQPSTIINQATSPPSNNHPYILIHNHFLTKHNTWPKLQTFTGTLYSHQNALRSTNPTFISTNQAEQFLTTPHCH